MMRKFENKGNVRQKLEKEKQRNRQGKKLENLIVSVHATIEIIGTEWGKYETSLQRNCNRRSTETVKRNIGNVTVGVNNTSLITGP